MSAEDARSGLPQDAREAAEAAYRGWRIGDDGEGRLHAALVAAVPLIRAEERERIATLAGAKLAVIGDFCRKAIEIARPYASAGVRSASQSIADAEAILAIINDEEADRG